MYGWINIACCTQTPQFKLELADDGALKRQLVDISGARLWYISINIDIEHFQIACDKEEWKNIDIHNYAYLH